MINSSPASVISPAEGISAEIVVVGSGPGGAITAAMLAEAGRDVLLIEEGPFLSLDSCPPFSRLEMEQKYRSRGVTVALGPTKINYVEGCCVGGGSEINSGLYHRTPPEILQRWHDQFAVADLSEEDLIPHFEAIEKEVSVSDSPGPLTPPSQVLKDGAAKLGWKSLTVPRWVRYGNETAGEHTARGRKQSMTETFIPRALAAGARLLPESRVRSMRRTGGRWRLKIVSPDNRNFTVEANTVFVSGGAIQTPALLQRSGVTKNVGRSLGLHPTVKIVARFAKEINYRELGVAAEQIKEFAPVLSFGCSIGAPEHLALSLLHHNNWKEIVDTSWKHMAIFYAALSTQSSGRVRSLPLFKDPLVSYQLSPDANRQLADGLGKLARVLFAAGATHLYPSVKGMAPLTQAEQLKGLPLELPASKAKIMSVHLFSSCPMGEDRQRTAVDSFGKVHESDNLYVADASLLCTSPSVNPQGSIMAIVRRNALRFLGEL